MKRAARGLVIAAIAVLGIWIGSVVGPKPRSVQADFYLDLLRTLELPVAGKGVTDSKTRSFRINGETMFYSVHSTSKSIEELFDHYAEHVWKRELQKAEQLEKAYGRLELQGAQLEQWPKAALLFRNLIGDNVFSQRTQDWGYLFALTKNLETAKPLQDLSARWESFLKTGNLGELGVANVILAYRDRGSDSTSYLRFWTGPDFHVVKLLPPEGSEPPGAEPPEIPRIPGARRFLSIEELSDGQGGVTSAYQVSGSVQALRHQMTETMRSRGWRLIVPENLVSENSQGSALYFEKGQSLATVSFLRSGSQVFYTVSQKF